ncbi:MAG: ABC transporter permease, partial [Planctomycetota bacterium]
GMPIDSWMFADYRMIASSASDELPSIYLGQNVSQRTELNAGDVINIFDQPFQIGGIFETSSVWENGSIIAPLESLQELTGREGQITYINVTVNDDVPPEDIDEVTGAIESTDPKLLALPTDAFVESDTRMQMAGAMAWMTSAIALIVGAIGTLNTMMTSVMERTGEIGILRAVGWTMKRVSAVILLESIALAVIATILGGIGASVLLVALSHSDAASGVLAPSIGPGLWLRGLAIGLFIGVLGAIGPSLRAAKMPPTLALRNL